MSERFASGRSPAGRAPSGDMPDRRIRVMHIIGDLEIGGAQTSLVQLLENLDRECFDFQVISLKDGGSLAALLEPLGVPAYSIGMDRDLASLRALPPLVRKVRSSLPDIIHAWLYHANLISGLAALLGGRPSLVWSIRHGRLDPDLDRRSTIRVARVGAKLSNWLPDRIICNSESARRSHAQFGYNERKMSVIPNGFDVERFNSIPGARAAVRRSLGIGLETKLIGHFGRFHPQKGQRIFLEAASIALRQADDLQFLMGGRGVDDRNEELAGWIAELGLQGRVHLLGLTQDMPRTLSALDVLAMTSLIESFPNLVGEAMACGVPCVATDVGAAAELVGDTGRLVTSASPYEVASAIQALFRMSERERIVLGARARNRIIENFTVRSFQQAHRELYVRLVEHG